MFLGAQLKSIPMEIMPWMANGAIVAQDVQESQKVFTYVIELTMKKMLTGGGKLLIYIVLILPSCRFKLPR